MSHLKFTLFIAGRSSNSQTALLNFNTIQKALSVGIDAISIVDVIEHPEQAEKKNILFTPLLEIQSETLTKPIIGNLSDTDQVINLIKSNFQ